MTLKLQVRMPESLHRKLVHTAGKNGNSLNGEIIARLERSFEADQLQALAAEVRSLKTIKTLLLRILAGSDSKSP